MAHVFLSYSTRDREFVDQLRADLQKAGFAIWIDKEGVKPGDPNWERVIRAALKETRAVLLVATPNSHGSDYVQGELAIAKGYNYPVFPVWAAGEHYADCVPLDLIKTHYIDARGTGYAAALPVIVETMRGLTTTELRPVAEPIGAAVAGLDFVPRNPYIGLKPFTAKERQYFFGRELFITDLLDTLAARLDGPRLLAVVGPSGSGKSSVVMAGLLPRLQEGALPGSEAWVYLDRMVPSPQPLESLCTTLANALPEKSNKAIREDLEDPEGRGLHLLACQRARGAATRVVLFVDQFEELFTHAAKPADDRATSAAASLALARRQFITLLTTAVTAPGGPLLVVLTLRADFYDRPMQHERLGALLAAHHVPVLPMTQEDLRAVIEKPAGLPDVQVTFEQDLVGDLLFDVRERVGGLPLLQFALDQLFRNRDQTSRRLTWAAYEAMGGLSGALARHAEDTYAGLASDEHRRLARTLMLRLIEPGTSEQDTTRRRAAMSELDLPDAQQTQDLRKVADEFVRARLLTTGEVAGQPTIEVSHEALIREWERLGEWLHDAREDVVIQQNVSEDAAAWVARGRKPDDDGLYRGTVLAEKLAWAERNVASAAEAAFLEASVVHERQLAQAAQRQQRRFRSMGIGLVATVLIAAVGLALIFGMNNARLMSEAADAQATITDANEQLATAEVQSQYLAAQQSRFNTLAAGQVYAPIFESTQAPAEFLATLTQIATLNAHEIELAEFDGVEMVRVPAGCFWMGSSPGGSSDEQPVHEVCFADDYWIDRYEVTNAAYQEFVEAGGYEERQYWTDDGWDWREANERTGPYEYGNEYRGAQQPRVGVSWYEADAYCAWREVGLATEAEWEYAARGPDGRRYPWGSVAPTCEVANFYDTDYCVGQTSEVGGYSPGGDSWVGAADMAGNVWEWVADWYGDYTDGRQVNPIGPEDGDFRVLRGGSFDLTNLYLRAANRGRNAPQNTLNYDGFRCARSR